MARTVAEIKKVMTDAFMSNETIAQMYGFNVGSVFESTFSVISLESIIFYCVAIGCQVVESMYDTLIATINTIVASMATPNLQWHAKTARLFKYGETYPVVYSAATELSNRVQLKLATDGEAGSLAKLPDEVYDAFVVWYTKEKPAGIRVDYITTGGDDLRVTYNIFFDPLVLRANGSLISNSSVFPAEDTVKLFCKNLPFDSVFIPTLLTDALQNTEGIKIPVLLSCETKYLNNDYESVDGSMIPWGGYLKPTEINFNYRPYAG